jgi:small basic protein (TIGR04137 family)
MSMDKSLRTAASLTRHRNVLKRHERIEVLKDKDRWEEDRDPIGLPKVAHRKAHVGSKDKKVKKTEGEEPKPEAT